MKKEILILKSKKKNLRLVLASVSLFIFFTFLFITDEKEYPKGKGFYWIAIILFGGLAVLSIREYIDKRPVYKLDNKGIHDCHCKNFIPWSGFHNFKTETVYTKYLTRRYADLFDKTGNKVLRIKLTGTDFTINRLEQLLKNNKLRQL